MQSSIMERTVTTTPATATLLSVFMIDLPYLSQSLEIYMYCRIRILQSLQDSALSITLDFERGSSRKYTASIDIRDPQFGHLRSCWFSLTCSGRFASPPTHMDIILLITEDTRIIV